jgi:hypothetical protein
VRELCRRSGAEACFCVVIPAVLQAPGLRRSGAEACFCVVIPAVLQTPGLTRHLFALCICGLLGFSRMVTHPGPTSSVQRRLEHDAFHSLFTGVAAKVSTRVLVPAPPTRLSSVLMHFRGMPQISESSPVCNCGSSSACHVCRRKR